MLGVEPNLIERESDALQRADTRVQPVDGGTATEFVLALRAWKIRAGNPSFHDLQRRTGIPRSTLADALNPQRLGLPRWEVVGALIQALAATPEESAEWRHTWTALRLQADRRAPVDLRSGTRSTGTPPAPTLPALPALAVAPGRILPRQLPPAIRHFTGRAEQLGLLTELADRTTRAGRPHGAAETAVISGPAGIGKTALALQWAHQEAARFPDGQLYLSLRGSGRTDTVTSLSGAAAVSTLLPGLLADSIRIPADPAARLSLYRSRMAGTRALLIVDDAVDADQVRPLLPGSSGCLVIVTSRDPLTDLVAVDGAEPVPLGPLARQEAHDLLARRLRGARRNMGAGTAEALVEVCGHEPRALNRMIARILARRDITPAELLAELDEDTARR